MVVRYTNSWDDYMLEKKCARQLIDEGWVEMLELNEVVAAKGTRERIDALIKDFKKGDVHVFRGDYLGVNPDDASDTYDLNKEYIENRNCSAPTFDYILQDVITIEE